MTEFFKLSLLAIEADSDGETQIEIYDDENNVVAVFNEEINEVILPILNSFIILNLKINCQQYCSMKLPLNCYKFNPKNKFSHWFNET